MKMLAMIVTICISLVSSCYIQGFDSGECTNPDDFSVTMPFCQSVVQYRACVPRYQSLWFNHSTLTKDTWIEALYNQTITQRLAHEKNLSLVDNQVNEWGEDTEIVPRFLDNPDCVNAFKNYFCWMNFPRCDSEGQSLLMCRSVCENFFIACQHPEALKRCGEPKYVNGYEAEVSTTIIDEQLAYLRYPFPGSPFRDNKFLPDTTIPIVVCTPSIENAAPRMSSTFLVMAMCTWSLYFGSF